MYRSVRHFWFKLKSRATPRRQNLSWHHTPQPTLVSGRGKPGNVVHQVSRYKPSPGVPQSSPIPWQLLVLTDHILDASHLSSTSSGHVAKTLVVGVMGSACLCVPSPVQHLPWPAQPCIHTTKWRAARSPQVIQDFSLAPSSCHLASPIIITSILQESNEHPASQSQQN